MSELKKPLPPRPVVTYQSTPDVAVANAIDRLSLHGHDRGKVLEMTSTIDPEDVPRIAMLLTLGQDPDVEAPWLEDYAHTELALWKSVPAKNGGILSEQLTEITKAPAMLPEQGGLIAGAKRLFGGGRR